MKFGGYRRLPGSYVSSVDELPDGFPESWPGNAIHARKEVKKHRESGPYEATTKLVGPCSPHLFHGREHGSRSTIAADASADPGQSQPVTRSEDGKCAFACGRTNMKTAKSRRLVRPP